MASGDSFPPLGTIISKSVELKIPGMESKSSGSVLLHVMVKEAPPTLQIPGPVYSEHGGHGTTLWSVIYSITAFCETEFHPSKGFSFSQLAL